MKSKETIKKPMSFFTYIATSAGSLFALIILFVSIFECSPCDSQQGCNQERIYSGVDYRDFEVLYIKKSKRTKVTLLDVKTHFLHTDLSLPRHCYKSNDLGRPKVNDTIKVNVSFFTIKDSTDKTVYYQINERHLKELFCR